jgi:hypothetical protein
MRNADVPRLSRDRPLRASLLQETFWSFEKVLQGEPVFQIPAAARLTGPLDVSALEQALSVVIARHEVLRTTFSMIDGALHQMIEAPRTLALRIDDLGELDERHREARLAEVLVQEARTPMHMDRGPLFRPRLFRLGADQHVLELTFHHVAVDLLSLTVLWKELWTRYEEARQGRRPSLPPPTLDFADVACWLESKTDVIERGLAYWRRRLDGIPVLNLPIKQARSETTGFAGTRRHLHLAQTSCSALQRLAQEEGVTLWMAHLAVLELVLGEDASQVDFGVGASVSMLMLAQREDLVGPLLNLVPLRVDLAREPSFRQLLVRVRTEALQAWAHRLVPWERIAELPPPCAPGVNPHFQVLFLVEPEDPVQHVADLMIEPVQVHVGCSEFDITVLVVETQNGIDLTMEYKLDLFDSETIDRLLQRYQAVVDDVVADPDRPVRVPSGLHKRSP